MRLLSLPILPILRNRLLTPKIPFVEPQLEPYIGGGIKLGYVGPNSQPLPMLDEQTAQSMPSGIKLTQWPTFEVAAQNKPLQTSGMCPCCAFRVKGPTGQHYLMHLDYQRLVSDIQKHLVEDIPWTLDDEKTELDLVPGIEQRTCDTASRLLVALHNIKPALAEKVRFRHFPDESASLGPNINIHNPRSVVSYQGGLFCYSRKSPHPVFTSGGSPIRKHIPPHAD
jgi:hypothetical protein